jgi:valyl-tRNA synthetase
VLEAIRRTKSSAKVSQRAEVASVTVRAPADFLAAIALCVEDLKAAGAVATLITREEVELNVDVILADA